MYLAVSVSVQEIGPNTEFPSVSGGRIPESKCNANFVFAEVLLAERRRSEIVSEIDATLGEWAVPHSELQFGKKLVDGGTFGHDVFAGNFFH